MGQIRRRHLRRTMKKLLLALLMAGFMATAAFAATPTIDEQNRLQFTAADQETTVSFRIDTIVWTSFTGSVIVDTDVLNLEDGAGTEIFKMSATAVTESIVIPVGGIVFTGIKAEDLTNGYVTIYGKRR